MFQMSGEQLAFLIAIALIVVGTRRISGGDSLSRLVHELRRHMAVFSAETTRGKDREFIRDSLPNRFPSWLVVAAAFVFVAVTVWLVGENLLQWG